MRSKGNKIPYFSFGFKKINNTYWAPTYGHLGNLYTSSGASYGANPEIISTSAIYIYINSTPPSSSYVYEEAYVTVFIRNTLSSSKTISTSDRVYVLSGYYW